MPIALPNARHLSIAVAAFMGAFMLTGNASAGCKSMPDCANCSAVVNCCKAKTVPPSGAATERAAVDPLIPLPDRGACRNIPGCICQPQRPVAPEPKGQHDGQNNPDPARNAAVSGWHGIASISRSVLGAAPPAISPSQKSPPYLRNSRLLI